MIYATSYTFGDNPVPQIHDVYDGNLVSIKEIQDKIILLLNQMSYKDISDWSIARRMTDAIYITAHKGNHQITFAIRQTEVLSHI